MECITNWVKEFDIDGLRLDVAYCLDKNFLKAASDSIAIGSSRISSLSVSFCMVITLSG